uniref:Uncharacterized protein n=1 Tax=Salix viminalis TaxID=40686 RepID=A0A6N2LWI7_SALVM
MENHCTFKNLMFMQRAAQRDERSKKQEEEVKPDGDSELIDPVNNDYGCFELVRSTVMVLTGNEKSSSIQLKLDHLRYCAKAYQIRKANPGNEVKVYSGLQQGI